MEKTLNQSGYAGSNDQSRSPIDNPTNTPSLRASESLVPGLNVMAMMTDSGVSDSVSAGPSSATLSSLLQPSTAPTDISFDFLSRPSLPGPSSNVPKVDAPAPSRREGRERKRARLDSEADALDSVDYWMQFDDDEPGQSFEIDYSKRRNNTLNQNRSLIDVNPAVRTPGLGTGLYSTRALKADDLLDDSALDNALSDDDDILDSLNLGDQLSKIDTIPPAEVPPREGLYSTPLSWEKPLPGLRMDPLLGLGGVSGVGGVGGYENFAPNIMSEAERQRLLAIALGPIRAPLGFTAGFGWPLSAGFGLGLPAGFAGITDSNVGTANQSQASKEPKKPAAPAKTEPTEKEKEKETKQRPQIQRTNTSSSDKGKEKTKGGDRTAHNDIERKYRTNLKDRIAELRDAVPSLSMTGEDGDDEESGGYRGPKASKGTVLTKATEYIHQLERKNKAIMKEHQELSRRIQAFEQLLNATARQPFLMPNYSTTLFDPRGFC